MTNDVMTNDQKRCADMQMGGCADGEECAHDKCADMQMCGFADEEECVNTLMTNDQNGFTDEEECANTLMTNDIMTNDQKYKAAPA